MSTRPPLLLVAAFAASLLLAIPATALAHIELMEPTPRTAQQKNGPCGGGGTRGDNVTEFEAGETITLRWEETINHPSHYRIAFDADGQDDLVDPAALDDYYTNDAVLLDEIPDKDGGVYEATVTLPNMECDNCTLQLIQVMYDKAPPLAPNQVYGDNDLYYQCADVVLVASGEDVGGDVSEDTGEPDTTEDAGEDTNEPADGQSDTDATGLEQDPSSDDGCGCSLQRSPPGPASGAVALILVGLLLVIRRRAAEI